MGQKQHPDAIRDQAQRLRDNHPPKPAASGGRSGQDGDRQQGQPQERGR